MSHARERRCTEQKFCKWFGEPEPRELLYTVRNLVADIQETRLEWLGYVIRTNQTRLCGTFLKVRQKKNGKAWIEMAGWCRE
jgi:hypothetical protein